MGHALVPPFFAAAIKDLIHNSCYTVNRNLNLYRHYRKHTEVPQKPKTETALLSNNHTSGYISKGDENTIMKKYLHYHVHSSIAHSSQDIKTS